MSKWFPGLDWFVVPSGTNLQGFQGVFLWLWDAPLPSHLIGGTLWTAFAVLVVPGGWWRMALVVVALLAVQQGAKWDSVRGYGWREIGWRLAIGVLPLILYLALLR
jgi:hypothetical protein